MNGELAMVDKPIKASKTRVTYISAQAARESELADTEMHRDRKETDPPSNIESGAPGIKDYKPKGPPSTLEGGAPWQQNASF